MSNVTGATDSIDSTPTPAPTPSRADPTFAWTLALLPLAAIPFVLLRDPWGWVAAAVVFALSAALAFADARQLKRVGVEVEPGLAFLSGIFYLVQRTARAGSTVAMPVVWVAAVAGFVAALIWFAPSTYDGDQAATSIEDWAAETYDTSIELECPDISGRVGDTATCDGTSDDGTPVVFRVTIEDDDYLSWELVG